MDTPKNNINNIVNQNLVMDWLLLSPHASLLMNQFNQQFKNSK